MRNWESKGNETGFRVFLEPTADKNGRREDTECNVNIFDANDSADCHVFMLSFPENKHHKSHSSSCGAAALSRAHTSLFSRRNSFLDTSAQNAAITTILLCTASS